MVGVRVTGQTAGLVVFGALTAVAAVETWRGRRDRRRDEAEADRVQRRDGR